MPAPSTTTSTESRALALLGQGLGPEVVAAAVGVSVSRVSQLLSDPQFSDQVAQLRYESLARHNSRDARYDELEEKLITKLDSQLDYMIKPFEILKAIQIINGAKRRGASAPESITSQQTVVALTMPTVIMNSYTAQSIQVNVNNQVIKAGDQELVTVQSSQLDRLVARTKGAQNALPAPPPNSP